MYSSIPDTIATPRKSQKKVEGNENVVGRCLVWAVGDSFSCGQFKLCQSWAGLYQLAREWCLPLSKLEYFCLSQVGKQKTSRNSKLIISLRKVWPGLVGLNLHMCAQEFLILPLFPETVPWWEQWRLWEPWGYSGNVAYISISKVNVLALWPLCIGVIHSNSLGFTRRSLQALSETCLLKKKN